MIIENLAIQNGFMKPKNQDATAFELFQAHFKQILNREHPLVGLADKIDSPRFDAAFADSYCEELGAPGKAIRLMVGLQYLKFTFDESDESVVDRWIENPYWQYFCGFTHMQHESPIDPSSMSRWRKRVGAERLALLLKSDHRVRRCFLSGLEGDAINITLAAAPAGAEVPFFRDDYLPRYSQWLLQVS